MSTACSPLSFADERRCANGRLDENIMEKFLNRHALRTLVWACGGAMRLDDRLQLGRDLIAMSTEDVPDHLGNGET